jgi:hypothetical protein
VQSTPSAASVAALSGLKQDRWTRSKVKIAFGGCHKVGFEGGQMPLQRRLPKRGFKSQTLKFNAEVTLRALSNWAWPKSIWLQSKCLVPALAQVVR